MIFFRASTSASGVTSKIARAASFSGSPIVALRTSASAIFCRLTGVNVLASVAWRGASSATNRSNTPVGLSVTIASSIVSLSYRVSASRAPIEITTRTYPCVPTSLAGRFSNRRFLAFVESLAIAALRAVPFSPTRAYSEVDASVSVTAQSNAPYDILSSTSDTTSRCTTGAAWEISPPSALFPAPLIACTAARGGGVRFTGGAASVGLVGPPRPSIALPTRTPLGEGRSGRRASTGRCRRRDQSRGLAARIPTPDRT
jgi:hypothetical protein